ncbi:NAD(P)/FAD-dependent oxidoreductase [Piscirickettsia salmonis]|uniref:NAD(P)/FAD-dependent oxidoreductase n=1 Tax=Piscirickettsia salmonis TaxID=1238 RepID=UPI0018C88692|nr:NAD(P)/FAD-dependent oxidoreductase [Piscirickettsia salmonis]
MLILNVDVVIVGAGAAGLMCAIEAGRRGRNVLIIDHANKVGKKILMSGGGRCNFTNLYAHPDNYLSENHHFCKSALKRFIPEDFIQRVKAHYIDFHEKKLGQLFCNHSSKDIVKMLLADCDEAGVEIWLKCSIEQVKFEQSDRFHLSTTEGQVKAKSLVVATGALSIPTMGATDFGHQLARQFNLKVLPLRAGLVPFTLHPRDLNCFKELSGVSIADVTVSCASQSFTEDLLFTHRGLSGPVILQISSYWQPGEVITIDLLPKINVFEHLVQLQRQRPKTELKTLLNELLPKRFVQVLFDHWLSSKRLADYNHSALKQIAQRLHGFTLHPAGTEGYRTAEVTLGGVSTDELSSKTLETKKVPGLYFIGEVVDVTGHLGGFNFQWAWASGYCAGQYV